MWNTIWNTIFNPKTKKYVQLNSISGQKILNSYLDHLDHTTAQTGGKKMGKPKNPYMGPCRYKSSTKRCSKGDKWNKEKCTKNKNNRCVKIRSPKKKKNKKKEKEQKPIKIKKEQKPIKMKIKKKQKSIKLKPLIKHPRLPDSPIIKTGELPLSKTNVRYSKRYTINYNFYLDENKQKYYMDMVIILDNKHMIPFLIYSKNNFSYVLVNLPIYNYHARIPGSISKLFHNHLDEGYILKKDLIGLVDNIFKYNSSFEFRNWVNSDYYHSKNHLFIKKNHIVALDKTFHSLTSSIQHNSLLEMLSYIPLPYNKKTPLNYFSCCSGSTIQDIVLLKYLIKKGYKINNIMFYDKVYPNIDNLEVNIDRDKMISYTIPPKTIHVKNNGFSPVMLEAILRKEISISGKVFYVSNLDMAETISKRNFLQYNFWVGLQPHGTSNGFKFFYQTFYDMEADDPSYINIWYDEKKEDDIRKIVVIRPENVMDKLAYKICPNTSCRVIFINKF